ncbi:MAG: hypothetical protein QM831_35680 [Kofleriaceae bacterium]
MIRFVTATSLIALAGCPPKSSAPVQNPQLTGAGCPAASGVFIASYLTQDAGKGRTGWVLPMAALKAESTAADYQPIDMTTAQASGVPAAPAGNLWLLAGATPCQVRIGSAYAAKVDASLSYGYELDNCPPPQDPQEGTGVVIVSQEPPNGCTFDQPKPVADRLGTMDDKKQWKAPGAGTPIPPALQSALPTHECAAPNCEPLWAIASIESNQQPVAWAGALNWLQVGDPAKPCDWKAERFSGFFIPGADGKAIQVTEGQDPKRPLALSAALVDKSGAHVLIAEGPGEYATYDLTPGKATLGHHTQWMLAGDEEWEAYDHLGPVCEPEPTPPAPMPKDAKPQSPYP